MPGLDGLRGVAVILVVAFHAGFLFDPTGSALPGGILGVDVFFVLSGFLITALLLGEFASAGTISLRRFYARRALRLLPGLLVVLAAVSAYAVLVGRPAGQTATALLAVTLYVANFVQAHGAMPEELLQTWSLAVEEQFYLLWPAALLALLHRHPDWVVRVAVLGVLASLLARIALFHLVSRDAAYMHFEARADGLLIGAITAALRHDNRLPRTKPWLAWTAVAFLLGSMPWWDISGAALYHGGFTLAALAAAVIIAAVLDGRWIGTRVLAARPLVATGRISYALYLWHTVVFVLLGRHAGRLPVPVLLVVAVTASFVLAIASRVFVETPFLHLKARLRTASPPTQAPVATGAHRLTGA